MTHTIKQEKVILSTRLFTVKRLELSLPDGKKRDYDLVDIQSAVTLLPVDDKGNVLFVKQFRVGSRSELLELPAGKIEANEDPAVTAARELREETGMAARELVHLGNFYMSPGYSSEYMYCYLARGLYHAPLDPDADEFLNVISLPMDEVRRMVRDNLVEDGKTLAVLMLASNYFPQM